MADRKLAYIATISQLDKIPDKDRIVYASLNDLGWQVIVDTSHKVGDKVIYIEVDSILPVKPEYEFLRKRCFSEKWNGFVIKGMKMAGFVSYGLVLPAGEYADKPDGYDMIGILEIRKKEDDVPDLPEHLPKSKMEKVIDWIRWKLGLKKRKKAGVADGWLSFAHKTDETRIENLSYLFSDEFKGTPVYITVKCDGQSATFAVYKDYFFMASRNVILYREKLKKAIKELNPKAEKPGMDNFKKIAARYDIPNKLNMIKEKEKCAVVIQGELCGPGIQKNPMGLPDIDFFVFNVYYRRNDNTGEKFLSWKPMEFFCETLKLKTVPFVERRVFDWLDKAVLKEYAKGKYENGKDREGIVIRYDSDLDPMPKALRGMSNMWSFKVINDDYVLGK